MEMADLCAPNHRDGVVHRTRAAADADNNEHFEGKTTE